MQLALAAAILLYSPFSSLASLHEARRRHQNHSSRVLSPAATVFESEKETSHNGPSLQASGIPPHVPQAVAPAVTATQYAPYPSYPSNSNPAAGQNIAALPSANQHAYHPQPVANAAPQPAANAAPQYAAPQQPQQPAVAMPSIQNYQAAPIAAPPSDTGGEGIVTEMTKSIWKFIFGNQEEEAPQTAGSAYQAAGQPSSPFQQPPVQGINQCFEYKTDALDASDWDSPNGWAVVNEKGGSRRLENVHTPRPEQQLQLVMRGLRCVNAKYTARIRLDQDSIGGIALRAQTPNDPNRLEIGLDTQAKTIFVKQYKNNQPTVLNEESIDSIDSQMNHELVVSDHGSDGLLEVSLDRQPVFMIRNAPSSVAGSFGPFMTQGFGAFGDLSVTKQL